MWKPLSTWRASLSNESIVAKSRLMISSNSVPPEDNILPFHSKQEPNQNKDKAAAVKCY
jgi:hypothetical protein